MNKKSMTAKELAEHFEVSERTILRDIETLSQASVPIYTSQGKGGGISIIDGFVLDKTVVSEEEQNQILFALQGISATQTIDTQKILSRLRTVFKKEDTDWISVDFSRWGDCNEDNLKFDILKNAIIHKMAVNFIYSNTHGETKLRKVYPIRLSFKASAWYLQAFCAEKQDYRTFKMTRIREVKELAESFAEIPLQAVETEHSTIDIPIIDIKLRFHEDLAYRVYDDYKESEIKQDEDGYFIVTTKVQDDYWLYSYILSFSDNIIVLEPQSVIDKILFKTEKIQNFYKENK